MIFPMPPILGDSTMRKFLFASTLFVLTLFISTPAFSQSQSGAIGGAVSDTSGALIPGVTIRRHKYGYWHYCNSAVE